jgi:hypothetical protein
MDFTIFYSWQSDSPFELNRRFIEQALRDAVDSIRTENSLEDLPVVDLGMERVPGSPEIATIMFRKIGRSAVLVADVTLVGEIKGEPVKKTANPNVMVEMGYAAAFLGWERIICVMNEHFGKAEDQPVDVRNRRFPLDYTLGPTKENEAKVKKQLAKDLKKAIQTVFVYELESANEAISLLDINCLNLLKLTAPSGFFSAPDPNATTIGGPFDTAKFNPSVLRLLDLGLIWSDFNPKEGKYAYHFTHKGKKIAEKLGFRPPATPGQKV